LLRRLIILLMVLALAACGSSPSEVATTPPSSDNCRRGGVGISDYIGQTAQERWERSELIVTGTVESVADGPYTVDEYGCPADRTSVLQLAVREIHKGALPAGATNRVYVAQYTWNVNATDIAPYLPVGAPAIAFLSVLPDPGRYLDWTGGRPAGQPLFEGSTSVYAVGEEVPAPEAVPTYPRWEMVYLVPYEAFPKYPPYLCTATDSSGSPHQEMCQTNVGTIQPQSPSS
jgi:hypothetical protein